MQTWQQQQQQHPQSIPLPKSIQHSTNTSTSSTPFSKAQTTKSPLLSLRRYLKKKRRKKTTRKIRKNKKRKKKRRALANLQGKMTPSPPGALSSSLSFEKELTKEEAPKRDHQPAIWYDSNICLYFKTHRLHLPRPEILGVSWASIPQVLRIFPSPTSPSCLT